MEWGDWKELIERNGGTVSDTVCENTDYLVVDAAVDIGDLEVATNHGVPAIETRELRRLLESSLTDSTE